IFKVMDSPRANLELMERYQLYPAPESITLKTDFLNDKCYKLKGNTFWVYAVERKLDTAFVGTIALVKDKNDDEIGYRFLQDYWGDGFGTEVCQGLIEYCRNKNIIKLTAYAVDKNSASKKILQKLNFKMVKKQIAEDLQLPETKYELDL
ncbi:MAG: GNAT family N-acetyltransferase, partial [Polaribacter sp.]|nr:GNAT family N-acetyltransferase [Polaribacter sp.]